MARYSRSSNFFVHRCNVERPVFGTVSGTIQGKKITQWQTILSNAGCWFEHIGSSVVDDGLLGRVPVDRYTVWFAGNQDIQVNDRLKKGATYYIVEGVENFTDEGWHLKVEVRKENYAQS